MRSEIGRADEVIEQVYVPAREYLTAPRPLPAMKRRKVIVATNDIGSRQNNKGGLMRALVMMLRR